MRLNDLREQVATVKPQHLIEALHARRLAEYVQSLRYGKLVDSWVSDDRTVFHRGRVWLRGYDGRLLPMISGAGVQGWEEALESIVADGTQISNSAAEALVCPDFNIPAYYMSAGRTMRLWAGGLVSNVVTTPGTFIARVRWGGLTGTQVLASGAQGLDTTAHTSAAWAMLAHIVCRSTGTTGSFLGLGVLWMYNLLASTAANLLPALMGGQGSPGSSAGTAISVDTTTSKLLSVTGQFSVATSPTNLLGQQRILEILN